MNNCRNAYMLQFIAFIFEFVYILGVNFFFTLLIVNI